MFHKYIEKLNKIVILLKEKRGQVDMYSKIIILKSISIYKERNTEYYMCAQLIECFLQTKSS